jgi:hypothetical protein
MKFIDQFKSWPEAFPCSSYLSVALPAGNRMITLTGIVVLAAEELGATNEEWYRDSLGLILDARPALDEGRSEAERGKNYFQSPLQQATGLLYPLSVSTPGTPFGFAIDEIEQVGPGTEANWPGVLDGQALYVQAKFAVRGDGARIHRLGYTVSFVCNVEPKQ